MFFCILWEIASIRPSAAERTIAAVYNVDAARYESTVGVSLVLKLCELNLCESL